MRRVILVAAIVSLVVAGAVWAANARALYCQNYTPQNCANIADWDWLRSADAVVTYEFDCAELAGCDPRKVHLNFAGLCTNGVSGGAGYSATLKVKLYAGDTTNTTTLKTTNPYRPVDANNSGGVGHQVYGTSSPLEAKLLEQAINEGAMNVELAWSGGVTPSSRHLAVKKDSFSLGYVK